MASGYFPNKTSRSERKVLPLFLGCETNLGKQRHHEKCLPFFPAGKGWESYIRHLNKLELETVVKDFKRVVTNIYKASCSILL